MFIAYYNYVLQGDEATVFLDSVIKQISEGIANKCGYGYSSSSISEARLWCSQSPKYVTIRGYVNGVEGYAARDILKAFEEWLYMPSTAFLTNNYVLDINKECAVGVSVWNEAECQPPPRMQCNQCACNCTHV